MQIFQSLVAKNVYNIWKKTLLNWILNCVDYWLFAVRVMPYIFNSKMFILSCLYSSHLFTFSFIQNIQQKGELLFSLVILMLQLWMHFQVKLSSCDKKIWSEWQRACYCIVIHLSNETARIGHKTGCSLAERK